MSISNTVFNKMHIKTHYIFFFFNWDKLRTLLKEKERLDDIKYANPSSKSAKIIFTSSCFLESFKLIFMCTNKQNYRNSSDIQGHKFKVSKKKKEKVYIKDFRQGKKKTC